MAESEVQLYVYDISGGMARTFLSSLLGGKPMNGIWHTAIVAYNKEYFFGSDGIMSCVPGQLIIGRPNQKISLGPTQIPYEVFMDHLEELGSTTFRGSCYHLFDHNCNSFSNELANFLTGKSIPSQITDLPRDVMETPIGNMIRQFVDSMSVAGASMFPEMQAGSNTRETINRVIGAERISPNKTADVRGNTSNTKDTSVGTGTSCNKQPETMAIAPPVKIYLDEKVLESYKERRDTIRALLRPNDFQSIEEVFEYVSLQQVDWSLHRNHLSVICNLILDASLTDEIRSIAGRLLLLALSRADFVDVCTHDSNQSLQNLIGRSDGIPHEVLLATAKSVCNFLAERRAVEWLFVHGGENQKSTSSSETVLAFGISCLLSENVDLAEIGCHIASNILHHDKVPGDVALRIGIALIEVVCSKGYPDQSENYIWFSLCECIKINNELVDLAKLNGLCLKTEEEQHPSITKYTQHVQLFFA